MFRIFPVHCLRMAIALLFLARSAWGDTLTLTNDIQTYATISTTTTLVTVTGRSELRITGATTPIAAPTIINLVPADGWLFLTNIRPSVVISSYLSRIQINGAAAVPNTNCRIVQHGEGTVVIPHASSLAPLQVFSGSRFTGTSASLQNYTAYNDASLGAFANKISSFKLKRGYTATIAQNASGTGASRNYVAQDGDIEVSVLPDDLNDSVSFVRVFPWRWVSKKGSCDVDPTSLNATWFYNWNIDQNSTSNWEYVAIKQQPNWPGLGQNWQTRQVNHLLGFNEPNNPVEDAYQNLTPVGSVSDAVARWPELLGTGLRLGAPAVTDGGYNWIVDFVNQAKAAGHRLDYVPIHYYRSYAGNDPQGAANSMYNFLKSIRDATGLPIWVTEFNNGANWTDNAHDPNVTQNRDVIEAMINRMDATPWIERYAIYSRVEWFRQTHYDDGFITPMGTMYRDHVAPLSHQQVIPEVPTAPAALYRFENDMRDSSANGHAAVLKGSAKFTAGHAGQGVVMSGVADSGDHVQLSTRLGDSTDFTFGAWVYPTSSAQWQRIFDLGSSTTSYMFLSPAAGSGNLRFAIADGGAEQQLNHNAPLPPNTWTHVAVTIGGNTGKLFVNGALVATNNGMTINPVDLATSNNFLGKSQFPDPLFAGVLDDVEFLNHALSDANVAAMQTNTPPQFTSGTITGSPATQNVAYSATIAGSATDADAGDTLIYSKVLGPDWLVVAANGALSGTPTFDDSGNQEFIVYASDRAGVSAFAVLTIQLPPVFSGNGTWTVDTDGNWSETAKWTGSLPANGAGFTANFSTLNIAIDRTVTLDASRTIGNLQFGDTGGTQNWTLAAANGRDLTLDAAAPVIAVNQNTATITASIDGTAGFTKNGAGTLVLKGDNPLSGTLYVDVSSTTENTGIVRLASLNSASGLTGIQIRNNNAGYSTLELDGTLGGITTPAAAPISLSGRGGTVPAIRNLAGSNTLAATLTIQSGGGNYYFQSDAGTLTLAGALTSNAPTSARSLTFQGAGNITLDGVVSNGTTTSGVGIIKNGLGTLGLGATNTFTGDLTINAGTVTAGTGQGPTPAASNLGALQPAANRNITINNSGILSLTGGNVLGTGASTNLLSNTTLVVNSGGLFLSGQNGGGTGWWNKLGAINLNGGTIRVGSGANTTNFQGLALIGTVTVGGSTASTIENHAASNGASNGIHLGQNATAGQIITFNVADVTASTAPDLTVSAKLINTSANLAASGLLKTGGGTLALSGANAYTGATTVSGGMLLVNGSTGTSAVTVATGTTLGGTGTVGGTVTVQSGGNLAPGAGGIGKLTTASTVMLQAGSTTRMEINKAAGTRDVLAAGTTLTYGGTLLVTNLGGTLTAGDSFTLFQAGMINGTFSTVTLPPLNFGFMWDTNALPTGAVSVVAIPSTYPGWASGYAFPVGTEASTYDADGDGTLNAFEWLFGANPLASDTGFLPQPLARTLSAAEYPAAVAGKHYLTMTARLRKVHTGMSLVPQASNSLASLDTPASAGLVASFLVSDLGDFEQRTWIHTVPIEDSTDGHGFMRLKVVQD